MAPQADSKVNFLRFYGIYPMAPEATPDYLRANVDPLLRRRMMKREILVEDRPPIESESIAILVLPLAIAFAAGLTLTIFLW